MKNLTEIKNECNAEIEACIFDSCMYYFNDYPEEREIYAEEFKKAFCDLIDKIKNEFDEQDMEEGEL